MLKGIYVFFIGLLTAIVIGTGIAAFYPAPKMDQPFIYASVNPTKAEQQQQQRKWDAYNKTRAIYDRNASLTAFVLGLIIGIAALALSAKIPVIGDGLLLGGIFSIVYAVGIGLQSGNDKFRFVIGLLGLLAALGIGYAKFVRPAAERLAA